MEYARDMSRCDPCATRPQARLDARSFRKEIDINFIETADRENFQARHIIRHAYVGGPRRPERERDDLSPNRPLF